MAVIAARVLLYVPSGPIRQSVDVLTCLPSQLADLDFLSPTRGAENRFEITTADGAVQRISGLGADRRPTATAMPANLLGVEHDRTPDSLPASVAERWCDLGIDAWKHDGSLVVNLRRSRARDFRVTS